MKSLGKQQITLDVFVDGVLDRTQPQTRVVYEQGGGTYWVISFGCKHQIDRRDDGFHWKYDTYSPEHSERCRVELGRRLGVYST